MTNGKDPIDQAIGATERTVTMCEVPVTIASSGRPALLHVPVDMSDTEVMELAAFMLLYMRQWIGRHLGHSADLWVPPT